MKKKHSLIFGLLINLFLVVSCSSYTNVNDDDGNNEQNIEEEITMKELKLKINDNIVDVDWENNESVDDLTNKVGDSLIIECSRYGGFEQVGSLDRTIVSNDERMTSSIGDIYLYNSSNIVIFYGQNTWSYTKLGHISNMTNQEIITLLDVPSIEVELFLNN